MTEPRKVVIGDAVLWLGDCREVLPTLGKVDAVAMDPPYGTQDLGGGYGRRPNWSTDGRLGRTITNDRNLDVVEAALPLIAATLSDGWLLAFYAARKTPDFVRAAADLEWFGEVIWDKAQPGLGYHIRYAHENIAVFRVGKPERPQKALLSVQRAAPVGEIHPHEKPIELMAALVAWACPTGGTVLDPFMGSGTTGVACAKLGRKFVGVEIDPQHFESACRRIEEAYRQPRLFAEPKAKPVQEPLFPTEAA